MSSIKFDVKDFFIDAVASPATPAILYGASNYLSNISYIPASVSGWLNIIGGATYASTLTIGGVVGVVSNVAKQALNHYLPGSTDSYLRRGVSYFGGFGLGIGAGYVLGTLAFGYTAPAALVIASAYPVVRTLIETLKKVVEWALAKFSAIRLDRADKAQKAAKTEYDNAVQALKAENAKLPKSVEDDILLSLEIDPQDETTIKRLDPALFALYGSRMEKKIALLQATLNFNVLNDKKFASSDTHKASVDAIKVAQANLDLHNANKAK